MSALTNFTLAFVFSFIGSIPPGTINLTLIQLGFQRRTRAALKFALAASIVEYPYAWLAVKFERLLLGAGELNSNIHLLAALIMIAIGLVGIWPRKSKQPMIETDRSGRGFRKGLFIGMLNPLAIPYWVAITAFLRSEGLISDPTGVELHSYLLGIVIGAFTLLALLILLSKQLMRNFAHHPLLMRLPGSILLVLGVISFIRYLIENF